MPPITTDQDELPVPKLCREILVAIEGLERWESSEGDEHLDFFEYLLEDLEATTDSRRGGFPLIRQLSIDDQDEIIKKLEELDEFAKEIKELEPEKRQEQYSNEEIQEKINEAETIYTRFMRLEEGYSTA